MKGKHQGLVGLIFDNILNGTMNEKQILGTYDNFEVYKIGVSYYCSIDGNVFCFVPYVICGEKQYKKNYTIYDISDFIEVCNKYASDDFTIEMLTVIEKCHKEDIENTCKKIKYIQQLKLGQEETKNKEKSTKRKRALKIPLVEIKDFKLINKDENIEYINFYTIYHNDVEYIVDMYKTTNNHFYANITDITNGYKEVSIDELKRKSNIQLTLDFFNI